MNVQEAKSKAIEILSIAKFKGKLPSTRNFLEYGSIVADAAKSLSSRQRSAIPWLLDWARTWRDLYDNFDKIVEADPMVLYEPANRMALEFHSSLAMMRYARAGNRTAKTQTGYAEHYLITTGQHRWRPFDPPPHTTGLLAGLSFSDYMPGVFEAKFLTGEQDNPLSPMFPVGGKWFYHYDERRHMISIACPECAEKFKAGTCKHRKSTIRLFSPEKGYEAVQGQAFVLFHFDEDTPEEFFDEVCQRGNTVKDSCIILTGTPLHGPEAWEQRRVASIAERNDPEENRSNPDDPNSPPLVSLHTIDMFEAGLTPHYKIKARMKLMDEFSIKARIYGEPLPLADCPVFDRTVLQWYKDNTIINSQRGELKVGEIEGKDGIKYIPSLFEIKPNHPMIYENQLNGNLRIWKEPEENQVYILCVDTAKGLVGPSKKYEGDYSCADVLRCFPYQNLIAMEQVAQYHGHINLLDYANEVMKLAVFYNSALVIVETTGGYGEAVILKLKNEYAYWNLYRPPTDVAMIEMRPDPRIGFDTNAQSKPFMITALQQFVKEKRVLVHCKETVSEMLAFTQETAGAKGSRLQVPRYHGAGGTKDDRVMSLAIGAAVVMTSPQLIQQVQWCSEQPNRPKVSQDMVSVYAEMEEDRKMGSLEVY